MTGVHEHSVAWVRHVRRRVVELEKLKKLLADLAIRPNLK